MTSAVRDQADGDPQVVVVGADEERLAGGDADAAGGEGDGGRALVGDPHPQVDAVVAGDGDAVRRRARRDTSARRRAYVAAAVGHHVRRRRVLQQLEQQRLEDPARPARPEQPAVGDGGDDVAGPADRGQAQVGPVALGVAADVHGARRAATRRG